MNITKQKGKNIGASKKLWEYPVVDGLARDVENSATYAPEVEDWLCIGGLHSREINGSTSYFSRPISRSLLSKCFDYKSKRIELMMVPDPYNEKGKPEMYLYMREHKFQR